MNLVEKLLKADKKKLNELDTTTFESKRLAKILGEEKVEITIREIPARRMNDIISMQFSRKGAFDMSKSFDAKAMCCVEGIIDPPVKDEELIKHFLPDGGTPKDLVIKLFGSEISAISDEIAKISGVEDQKEDEDEIKN